MPLRRTASVVAAVAATFAVAAPAGAVQTKTFGLQASGSRTTIVHPAGPGVVHDSVVVFNRVATPITVDLDVVSETRKPDGNYEPGPSGEGLAGMIDLSTRQVRLAPHARRTVPFTIDRPGSASAPLYAAITAVAASRDAGGGLGVTEQLAVLVGVTAGGADDDGGLSPAELAAIILVALLVAALGVTAYRRRGLSFRHASRP
ncbi:MAG: hypothetical protein QOJ03_2892 [Frankiaceae bacterium]|nr:hypothetical protein [Frankiaceae bacterium]